MTTRRDTRKYQALMQQPQVAILVHDFERTSDIGKGTLSITLRGRAIEQTGEVAERLRSAHLARNLLYANFISGDGIAVIAVEVSTASMCTLDDKVHTWEAPSAPTAAHGGE